MSTIEKALAKQKMVKKSEEQVEATSLPEQTSATEQASESVSQELDQTTVQNASQETVTSYEESNYLTLDKESLEERGFLIDTGTRKSIKDELRQIKRKLLSNAFGDK